MSWVATAVVGGAVVGGLAQDRAADKAAEAQVEVSEAGISEQSQQFDKVVELLRPYTEAGHRSIEEQNNLLGLNGPEAQAAAIEAIKGSPQYESLIKTGEEALLQNAAATGGLRGGNIQDALTQYRPQILSQLIESQFGKLGQVSGLGQASAAGTGAAAQNTGNMITQLLQSQGAARAGQSLARGQSFANIGEAASTLGLLKGMKVF